jgi:hypothetical protein
VPFRILEPFVLGDYPSVMKKIVGPRLPQFTRVQSEAVRGALDFVGLNYYYSLYVNDRPLSKGVRDFTADMSIYIRGIFPVHTGFLLYSSYPSKILLFYLVSTRSKREIYIVILDKGGKFYIVMYIPITC